MDISQWADRAYVHSLPKINSFPVSRPSKASAAPSSTSSKPESDPSSVDNGNGIDKDPRSEEPSSTTQHQHHHHHHHLRSRPHRRHHTRDAIQSAVQLQHPFNFDNYFPLRRSHNTLPHDAFTQATATPDEDRGQPDRLQQQHTKQKEQENEPGYSRHQSQQSYKLQQAQYNSSESQVAIEPIKKIIHPEDLSKEKLKRKKREEEVSEALNALSRDALTATRKLDDTYYGLLEKLGILNATLASLQQLTTQTSEARREFEGQSQAAKKDIERQVDSFSVFDAQQETVDQLVTRLRKGKERSATLEERLEACRQRLEEFERHDKQASHKSAQRWRICYCSLAAFVLLLALLVAWRHSRADHLRTEKPSHNVRVDTGSHIKNHTVLGIHIAGGQVEKEHAKEEMRWEKLLDEL